MASESEALGDAPKRDETEESGSEWDEVRLPKRGEEEEVEGVYPRSSVRRQDL